MKIACDKNKLSEAIRVVSKAVAKNSNLRAIEGILLSAEDGILTLIGYDFDFGIKTSFECSVYQEGDIVLDATLLGNIVRKLSADEITIESDPKQNCIIKGGITKYNIKGIDSADYPEFPNPAKENGVKIENSMFAQMCDYVIYAVSTDEKRPAHTGVLIKCENNVLSMVALDGYRLAVCERNVDIFDEFSIIVPAKAMNEVKRIVDNSDGKMTIYAQKRYVLFEAGDYVVLSRLLRGEFLDYRKTIPQNFVTVADIRTKEFIETVERVSLIITEKLRNPVKLKIEDGVMGVKCATELGEVYDEMNVEHKGDNIEIGFNNKYVLDALRASKKDELIFQFSGPLSPCKVVPKEGNDFMYLILPVRFKND